MPPNLPESPTTAPRFLNGQRAKSATAAGCKRDRFGTLVGQVWDKDGTVLNRANLRQTIAPYRCSGPQVVTLGVAPWLPRPLRHSLALTGCGFAHGFAYGQVGYSHLGPPAWSIARQQQRSRSRSKSGGTSAATGGREMTDHRGSRGQASPIAAANFTCEPR